MISYVEIGGPSCKETRDGLSHVLREGDALHGCALSTYYNAVCSLPAPQTGSMRYEPARFWLCTQGGMSWAAVMHIPGALVLCDAGIGTAEAREELNEFLDMLGGEGPDSGTLLLARASLLGALNRREPGRMQRGRVMCCRAGTARPDREAVLVRENLRGVYTQLTSTAGLGGVRAEAAGDYDTWLSVQRLKQRAGLCGVYALFEGERLVSTASLSAFSEKYGEIGSVFTCPDRRGRGLAARLVLHLCAVIQESRRVPLLACRPALEGFYAGLGFEAVEDWAATGGNR